MSKSIIKSAMLSILFSLIILGIGYVIAILIVNRSGFQLQDVLFVEGIIVIALGLMLSMRGNPSGVNFQGLGQQNANQTASWNLEVTRVERDKTGYYKNFLQHSVLEFAFSNLVIMLGGLFIVLFSLSSCFSPHITIETANVEWAYIHLTIKDENQIREITGSDLNDLVDWFNNVKDIRSNPTFKGATTIVGMKIELRDRRHITILDSGDNFEIQIADPINGKTVSYLAKEPHIESMLATIDNVQ